MKNLYIIICTAVIVTATASCQKGNFLDTKTNADLTKEITFSDSANTIDFLSGLYIDIAFNFQLSNNNADFSKMSDEAEGKFPASGNFDKVITQGTFANNFYGQFATQWANFYKDIHNVNILLAEIDKSPLSADRKSRAKAEARFLRVFYYSWLTTYFGGVPLVGDNVYSIDDDPKLGRGTYEECVNYMVGELDAIANSLPLSYSGLDYGRVTKGACLALKSRILLFAASPLFNGGSTATNPELKALTGYPTYDASRWDKAMVAAKAVMDLGVYALNTDNSTKWGGSNGNLPSAGTGYGFYNLFISRVNNEFILGRPLPTGKQIENQMNPKSRGGDFYYFPTQELVDMFPTINGKPITDDVKSSDNPTGYDETNPYFNRDPRFAATVIYNGSLYFYNSAKALAEVNTYVGAPNDGIVATSSNTSTCTGYYTRKLCDELAAVTGGGNVDRSLPVIRYAEILLNYAEASNEAGKTAEAINALKQLRVRAGINPGSDGQYGLPENPTLLVLRSLIQNERAIELAFEHHRFWDVRRWKIGGQIDGKMLHGMRITKTGTNYSYKKVDIRTHYFKEIYYYWPIPLDEVTLSGGKILQNPGY